MKKPKAAVLIAILFAIPLPEIALACSVPTVPFDPSEFRSGVILEGTIRSSYREGRMITVILDVERVVQGQFHRDDYTFSFFPAERGGECLPASTQVVPEGQRLVVYLERRDAGLWRKGWMHYEDAEMADYRVRVPSGSDR